ncbi:MAG: SagB family peptide dehydrogenase [Methylophilaceae bacterium]|jgi:SagB-type dehydrogenase family enzyme|nr:SagB family peptide dehydrogenase [Methylophilaceae bacterium]
MNIPCRVDEMDMHADLHTVLSYHQYSKHRFEAYAPGPEALDWNDQPAAFRHFEGAEQIALPTLAEAMQDPALGAALHRPFSALVQPLAQPFAPLPANAASLSALLQLSLGITAWKSWGPDRWAVRANPSSGNLHPAEAYLFLRSITGFSDGLYHYCPYSHALERRATFTTTGGSPQVLVALSSVMWREAWKYGERGFRYCQLDTGHAVGALRYAAALLGWPLAEQRQASTSSLQHWLGLDRSKDFTAGREAYTECEEAEILLSLTTEPADMNWLQQASTTANWHGKASAIDRHPMYRWQAIDEVALATRHAATDNHTHTNPIQTDQVSGTGSGKTAAQIILQRRSAQRFDARHVMPQADFHSLLAATLPSAHSPWDALASEPHISLVLFVHRVEGLQPGLYLLPRTDRLATLLDASLNPDFLRTAVESAPPDLGLQLLTPAPTAELQRVARSIHCHQDVAANSCFALGMLAEFDAAVSAAPASYRDLLRETGLIGQVLYLQAEALGLRGTGIGCYFDDPFHNLLGLKNTEFQSLYHFTVGLPLEDSRIETSSTYEF